MSVSEGRSLRVHSLDVHSQSVGAHLSLIGAHIRSGSRKHLWSVGDRKSVPGTSDIYMYKVVLAEDFSGSIEEYRFHVGGKYKTMGDLTARVDDAVLKAELDWFANRLTVMAGAGMRYRFWWPEEESASESYDSIEDLQAAWPGEGAVIQQSMTTGWREVRR